MTRFSALAATTALATVFAGAAQADVSPREVWDSWSGYLSGFGYEVSATESEGSGRLDVSGLVLGMTLPEDEGTVTMSMGDLSFVDQGDGTVRIEMPSVMPIDIAVDAEGEKVDALLNITYEGMQMVASGAPMDITYTYSAASAVASLDKLMVDGQAMEDFVLNVALNALAGSSSMAFGDMISMSQTVNAGSVTFDIDFAEPGGDESVKMTGAVENLAFSGSGDMPTEFDTEDPASMFRNGFGFVGKFTHGVSSANIQGQESSGQTVMDVQSSSGSVDIAMDSSQIRYNGSSMGVAAEIMGPDVPLPVSFGAGEFGWGFQMPLMASEEQQAFGASLSIVDLTIADMLWGIFDPTGALPRDPATLTFKLDGLATLFHDLTDPAIEELETPPGEVNALDLTSLLIKVAGASVTGEGSFTFDNTDLETFDGMPRPLGALNLNAKGLNGLIDKLVQMGLLPEDQAMGARMMMGLFAVPGPGDDELSSTIEVNEQGHLLANGQRLQ